MYEQLGTLQIKVEVVSGTQYKLVTLHTRQNVTQEAAQKEFREFRAANNFTTSFLGFWQPEIVPLQD